MDSISKICFDLDKLGLFETPNFYYCLVKGKLAKNFIFFYILRLFNVIMKLAKRELNLILDFGFSDELFIFPHSNFGFWTTYFNFITFYMPLKCLKMSHKK